MEVYLRIVIKSSVFKVVMKVKVLRFPDAMEFVIFVIYKFRE
jgi:hypothetical protein